jgi:hypothetical protein
MCRQQMKLPASIGNNIDMFMYCMIILYSIKYKGSDVTIQYLWYDELTDED